MSFHLDHPALTTTGKKKGKRKFRTAEAAQRARAADADWALLLKKHGVEVQKKKQKRAFEAKPYTPPALNYRGANDPKIPSLAGTWDPCTKAADKVYTGDKMIGIAVMHKSNAVPVFTEEAAKDISKMRR